MKFALILALLLPTLSFSQQTAWFADAKLGIFIHWGMYAADGTSESWAFHNKTVPYAQYMSQMNRFTSTVSNTLNIVGHLFTHGSSPVFNNMLVVWL
jgi:hypothetical protein